MVVVGVVGVVVVGVVGGGGGVAERRGRRSVGVRKNVRRSINEY